MVLVLTVAKADIETEGQVVVQLSP